MPRKSKLIRWERTDGVYRVAVFARTDHDSFRVESGWCGTRAGSQASPDERDAIEVAEGIWLGYQRGAVDKPAVEVETLHAMIDAIVARAMAKGSAKTASGYHRVWNLFEKQVGARREPKRVYPSDVRCFLAGYSNGQHNETHNTYLRTLRAGFRFAIGEGWMREDPSVGIGFLKRAELGPWISYRDWDEFLHRCSDVHRIRAAFALETGCRAGEIAAARWDWIVGDIGIPAIRIAEDKREPKFTPKWGKARAVPLTKVARELLDQAARMWCPTRSPSAFIFSADGLSALGNLSRANRQAVERSAKAGTNLDEVTFHGLRRSAGAHWLDCGTPLLEVSRLLGHRSVATTERWYAGLSESTLVGAIRHVESVRADHEATRRSPKRSPKDGDTEQAAHPKPRVRGL